MLQDQIKDLTQKLDENESALTQQSADYQKQLDTFSKQAQALEEEILNLTKDKDEIIKEIQRISFLSPMEENAPLEETPLMFARYAALNETPEDELAFQYLNLSSLVSIQQAYYSKIKEKITEAKPLFANYPAIWPLTGRLSSGFGFRRNVWGSKGMEFHSGMDIAVPIGTDIAAAGGGVVTFAGTNSGYGNLVIIRHGSGLETCYGHCSKLLVKAGDIVIRGQIIARSGSTGSSTGPHLHYEVRKDGKAVDPITYLP